MYNTAPAMLANVTPRVPAILYTFIGSIVIRSDVHLIELEILNPGGGGGGAGDTAS